MTDYQLKVLETIAGGSWVYFDSMTGLRRVRGIKRALSDATWKAIKPHLKLIKVAPGERLPNGSTNNLRVTRNLWVKL